MVEGAVSSLELAPLLANETSLSKEVLPLVGSEGDSGIVDDLQTSPRNEQETVMAEKEDSSSDHQQNISFDLQPSPRETKLNETVVSRETEQETPAPAGEEPVDHLQSSPRQDSESQNDAKPRQGDAATDKQDLAPVDLQPSPSRHRDQRAPTPSATGSEPDLRSYSNMSDGSQDGRTEAAGYIIHHSVSEAHEQLHSTVVRGDGADVVVDTSALPVTKAESSLPAETATATAPEQPPRTGIGIASAAETARTFRSEEVSAGHPTHFDFLGMFSDTEEDPPDHHGRPGAGEQETTTGPKTDRPGAGGPTTDHFSAFVDDTAPPTGAPSKKSDEEDIPDEEPPTTNPLGTCGLLFTSLCSHLTDAVSTLSRVCCGESWDQYVGPKRPHAERPTPLTKYGIFVFVAQIFLLFYVAFLLLYVPAEALSFSSGSVLGFHFSILNAVVNYVLACGTEPGTVPNEDPAWADPRYAVTK